MSSTNRINAEKRHVADYYVTPVPSIKEFLDAFRQDWKALDAISRSDFEWIDPFDDSVKVIDPCAGGDAVHEMSYPVALKNYSQWNISDLETLDVRLDSRANIKTDFLFWNPMTVRDVAITNPPFNIALDVIQKCLREVRGGGLVIMLLRLNFFGSQERSAWFKSFMPLATYVHSKRMKFTNTGGTDSIEYMHAVWRVGYNPKHTHLRVL